MKLKEIQAFRAVMQSGTTIGAADLLLISQPAVSRHIASLEQFCGCKLFDRRSGRLYPTEEAEALLHEVEIFQEELDRVEGFARRLSVTASRHLRVLATNPMAHGLLPPVMATFHRDFPSVTSSLHIVSRRRLREGLASRPFDIGVITLPVESPLGECEPMTRARGVCIVPPGHRLEGRSSVAAQDLAGESFIWASPSSPTRHMIEQVLRGEGVLCHNIAQSHSAMSICQLVLSGVGLSIVDPFTARIFEPLGLRALPFEPALYYEFGMAYPPGKPRSRLVTDFSRYLRDGFARWQRSAKVTAEN